MAYEALTRASSTRMSHRGDECDVDEQEALADQERHVTAAAGGGGCDEDDGLQPIDDDELAGALEMLPIPCTISCAPGLPAILLVNPPTDIPGAHDTDDTTEPATPDNQLVPAANSLTHNRLCPGSSSVHQTPVEYLHMILA